MSDRELDQQLVERVQRGDKQAFGLLVSKYQRKLNRLLSRLIRDPAEVEVAVSAAREMGAPAVIATYAFQKSADESFRTMMGNDVTDALRRAIAAGADVVGANCGTGIADIVEIAALMRGATGLHLWMKPNAGLPELIGGNTVYRESPDEFASRVADLLRAGATIVGGCCGTTPAHIAGVRKAVDGFRE